MSEAAVVAWLIEETEQQPVYTTWEDLHWVDPSTLEVLTLAVDQAPTAKLYVVLTCRPEFSPPWGTRSHLSRRPMPRCSMRSRRYCRWGQSGLLADRGFADTELLAHLRRLGWHSRIRIKPSFEWCGRPARKVEDFPLAPRRALLLHNVAITAEHLGGTSQQHRWVLVHPQR